MRRPSEPMMVARGAALVLALALAAAGCGGAQPTSSSVPGTTAAPASGSVTSPGTPTGAVAARVPLDQEQLRAYEDALIAGFVRSSGVEAALGGGGWAFVDEFIKTTLADELAEAGFARRPQLVASTSADPPLTAAGGGAVAGVGLVMAASLVSQSLANPNSGLSNANVSLDSTSERTANGQRSVVRMTGQIASTLGNGRITATVGIGVDVTTYDAATGQQTGTVSFNLTGTVELDLCPDASGNIKGRVSMALGGGTSAAASGQLTVDADVVGLVNDSAYLESIDVDGSTTEDTTSPTGTGRGSTVSFGLSGPVQTNGTFDPNSMDSRGQVDSQTGEPLTNDEVTERYERVAGAAGFALALLSSDAQKQWRGGACVEIHATESSRDVRPREHVQFTATPFHKIEQRDLSKPIVATFAGEASAQPLDTPIPAPALFDYQASPTKDHTGTITLKTTSNRGIGTLDLTFTTRINGWKIDQPSGGGRIEGRHCGDAPGEWDVSGTYEMMDMTGLQQWLITIDANGTTGHYDYITTSEGKPGGSPVTVFTEGSAEGTVSLTIDQDGTARMHLTETKHVYRAWTEAGGKGSAQPRPLEESDMEWEPDPTC